MTQTLDPSPIEALTKAIRGGYNTDPDSDAAYVEVEWAAAQRIAVALSNELWRLGYEVRPSVVIRADATPYFIPPRTHGWPW